MGARAGTRLAGTAACGALALLVAASMLHAGVARAQGSSCDSFKGALAARLEAGGVRGYSLDLAPAGTPTPAGAKVIGTCEGGAVKIVYRRWGAAGASAGASTALQRPAPVADRLAVVPPVAATAAAASVPVASAVIPVAARTSQVDPARVAEPAPKQAEPMLAIERSAAPVSLPRRAVDVMGASWPWIAAVLLLPLAGWFWAWRRHRSAYDEAGLPRGPRL
ncbi:DUF1161 domain-containing protein [Piscinibacter sp. XHJ-5]|uniref:DUF1161 domain-containing protein n=1 Tax=Piscinibacter sp. XHJ-5 TaxID=3037797 RepID=UPI002452C212|nr:DUF1161 domain-containing protein [Piscinibacter sp. XHJ-5]